MLAIYVAALRVETKIYPPHVIFSIKEQISSYQPKDILALSRRYSCSDIKNLHNERNGLMRRKTHSIYLYGPQNLVFTERKSFGKIPNHDCHSTVTCDPYFKLWLLKEKRERER
jgi:hypothetical protein